MEKYSPGQKPDRILSGPGKFCRSFDLTILHSELDLTGDVLYLEDRGEKPPSIEVSTRVGIKKATDGPWRFFDANSPAVSKR